MATYAEIFPEVLNNTAFWQRAIIFRDNAFDCPSYYIASGVAGVGLPAWKMRFASGTGNARFERRLPHRSIGTSGNATLAAQLKQWFVSFVAELDTNALQNVSKPAWPQYHIGNYQILDVEQRSIGIEVDRGAGSRCQFFQEQAAIARV
jgi:hypothetical protein